MTARIFAIVSALLISSTVVSSTALAWSVPIHRCTFPNTPTPAGDPIPCSFTNQDGITFNGVVTTTSNGEVLCSGMLAPTPQDPTEAQSIEELYSSLGDDFASAPFCALQGSKDGPIAECWDEVPANPSAYVQVCFDSGPCLDLSAYTDCADYIATEIQFPGVTCYDLY